MDYGHNTSKETSKIILSARQLEDDEKKDENDENESRQQLGRRENQHDEALDAEYQLRISKYYDHNSKETSKN
jgi:hypothetical protein